MSRRISFLLPALTIAMSACASDQDAARRSMNTRFSAANCAAEGQQLDNASGSCVAVRPAHRVASINSESRAVAPASSHKTPIESHAIIDESLKSETKLMTGLVALLRSRGYQCGAVSSARPFSTSNGFSLTCDHARHRYAIEATKGSWDIRTE